MSLDISVTNKRTGDYLEMNWLRNPFGLCQWAEDNYLYVHKLERVPEEESLWYVINHWNYDKAVQVDRRLMLSTVQRYGECLTEMERGFFWFDLARFPQNLSTHIVPDKLHLPYFGMGYCINVYHNDKVGIPIEDTARSVDLSHKTLADYQQWYWQLIDFAHALQDPDAQFYCSN